MSALNKNDDAFGFGDATSQDAKVFAVLPENTEVEFTVVEFKKAQTAKGDNMAKLQLLCKTKDGLECTLRENLVLLRRCEWRINQLFCCVGLRKHGERSVPKWGNLLGSHGRATLGIEQWEKDGKLYDGNVIKDYLEPVEKPETSASAEDVEDLF